MKLSPLIYFTKFSILQPILLVAQRSIRQSISVDIQ